jgi:hypothetical protein
MKLDVCNILLYCAPAGPGLVLHACQDGIVYIASKTQVMFILNELGLAWV